MHYEYDEVPRYRKKRAKKPPKKTDHKHEYYPVIINYRRMGSFATSGFAAGSRCAVCGKIIHGFPGNIPTAEPIPHPVFGQVWRTLDLVKTYPQFPIIEMADLLG